MMSSPTGSLSASIDGPGQLETDSADGLALQVHAENLAMQWLALDPQWLNGEDADGSDTGFRPASNDLANLEKMPKWLI